MSDNLSYEELWNRVNGLPPEEQKTAMELLAAVGIDLSRKIPGLTGTGVCGFIFGDKVYKADSHKEVCLTLTGILLRMHREKEDRLFEIKGTKKKYFSKNPYDFRHGYEGVIGTDVFMDTNENAVQLNRRCQRILQAFGYNPSSVVIMPDPGGVCRTRKRTGQTHRHGKG